MDSHEDYLDALTAYSRSPTREIPPILDQYLNGVAKNGETLFQWALLKPLVVGKTEQVIGELRQGLCSENIPQRPNVENVRFDVMHSRIMDALQKFNGAPFTIQRLCELLVDPKRHYKRSDKFMRGLEKNVLVVSTVDPFGRKVVSESGNKHLVNGMDTNGSPFFPRDSNITTNLPPVPGWVTSPVSMAAREPNTSASDSPGEQRQAEQTSSQASALTANGVEDNIVSSVYADQGEQPLAVHGEEVVEETVVTMDTNEVGPAVATDGGEGMAVDEEEEEEMGGEDTNASTSSSSSSSSEELASIDTSGNTGSASSKSNTPSTSGTGENRPWASIANEGENKKAKERILQVSATSSPNKFEDISSDSSSSQSPSSKHSDTSLSSSTERTTLSIQPTADEQSVPDKGPVKSNGEDTVNSTTQQQSLNKSLGFSPSEESVSMTEETQKDDIVSTSTPNTEESASDSSDRGAPATVITSTAISKSPQVSGDHIRTYAEVLAASPADSASRNITSLDTTEECDSVAGLERLVDSVEPSPSPLLPALSSFQSSLQSPPKVNQNTLQSESSSSSTLTSTVDSEEPPVKRSPSLPVSEAVSSQSNTDISPSSEPEVAPSSSTTSESDATAKPESPNITVSSSDTTAAQNCETMDQSVTCSNEEAQPAKPSTEQGGVESLPPKQENVSSTPSSQLALSSDSMGFEMCGDNTSKSSEKCSSEKDSAALEVQSSDTTSTGEVTKDKESNQEPMDQQ